MADLPAAAVESTSTSADEAALVAALRAGDEQAYERLVRTLGGRLLSVARRLVGNDADAQDVVQDTFLAAFKALPRFAEESRLSTWLYRIAVNSALTKVRTRRRHPEERLEGLIPAFQPDGHHVLPVAGWTEPADVLVARSEVRELIRREIDALPDTHRTVLVLRDLEEMSTEETAKALGISTNAVKLRLHRARQALGTRLAGALGDRS